MVPFQTDGPIEYQIPNAHPASAVTVKSLGKRQVQHFDGSTVNADTWQWTVEPGPETFTAWTTPDASNSSRGVLQHWNVNLAGMNYTNDYVNYTAVPADKAQEFINTLNPPSEESCRIRCGDLFKAGTLSEKSLSFLRAGKTLAQKLAGRK